MANKLNRSEIPVEDGSYIYAPNPLHAGETATKGKNVLAKGKTAGKKQTLTGAPLSHKQALTIATNPGKGGVDGAKKSGKSKKA